MALSEIEKLERRYAENPQGLTFAPLAEVHRKSGDVARALDLLRPGLTLHPDYIPASIVLGRCHLDVGELPAAEAAFNHVLSLDAENVIALKALADIAERMFRFDDAERVLNALLVVDRSNDEARDQLSRIEAARQQAAAGESVAPESVPAAPEAVGAAPEAEPATAASGPEAAEEPVAEGVPIEPAVEEPASIDATGSAGDTGLDWATGLESAATGEPVPLDFEELESDHLDASEPRPEGIQLDQPVALEDEVEPIAGLVGRDEDSPEPSPPFPGDDFRVETAEDIVLESSGGSEFQMANAAEELLVDPAPQAPEPEPIAPAAEPPADDWVLAEAATDRGFTDEPVASEPVAAEPEPPLTAWTTPTAEPDRPPEPVVVITESMAQLLLQQGYRAEALTVYRHLADRSPGDPRLLQKIGELEGAASEPAPVEPEPPAPAWSVTVTRGRSVKEFLGEILAARPPAVATGPAVHGEASPASGADREGAPTRPAHDSLSLSSVFGEESTPNAPAVPAAGAGPSTQGGVSFDEFFGAPGGPATARPARSPDSKSDDLDQFHAWLQNLKR